MTQAACETKRGLRRNLRTQRDALSAVYRANCADHASQILIDHSIWQSAQVVATYLPHQSEFDPTVITRCPVGAGKRFVYPRVVDQTLQFHEWHEGDIVETAIGGVLQPHASAAPCAIEDIDLFLTPLLGCGASGMRLGYGGGFYDRVFACAPGYRLGIGFAMQRVADWTAEAHDQRLNAFLSESGLVVFD